MLGSYFGILVMFVCAGAVSVIFLLISELLGPKKPNAAKAMPYECGEKPFGSPSGRQMVKFYLAGMLFVLFDVEMIFFFPRAVVFRELGWGGLASMIFFLIFVGLGFIYAWRRGGLEWK